MTVKIDTKAHFRVFRLNDPSLHANMAETLNDQLLQYVETQAQYQQRNVSFVLTGFRPELMEALKEIPSFQQLNKTLTLAEATDLVMMEKLERELK